MRKPSDVLTPHTIARVIRCAPRTVAKLCDSGKLKAYRLPSTGIAYGGHRRVRLPDLVRFMRDAGMPADWIAEAESLADCPAPAGHLEAGPP